MTTPGILDERVTGNKFCLPQHPRVEPLAVRTVLHRESSEALAIGVDLSLTEALKLMFERGVTAVLVLDGKTIRGIFSEHEALRRLILEPSARTETTVGELTTPCDHFAHPGELVHDCLARMAAKRLKHLVVAEDSKPPALLSLDVLLKAMVGHLEAIHREILTDQQTLFLRGTYSC